MSNVVEILKLIEKIQEEQKALGEKPRHVVHGSKCKRMKNEKEPCTCGAEWFAV